MKAAVLEAFGEPLVVREVPDPALAPDGVILRVKATGVCRSDWHVWSGEWKNSVPGLPHILGHEMSGVVEKVGSAVRNFKPGDRVIVPFSQGDGVCPHCLAGHQNMCDHLQMPGFTYNGGFAELVHVPNADRCLIHLPDDVDFVDAAAMGCRFMTAFHGVLRQGEVRPGEWVAVFGAGGVGLSAIQVAVAAGANVIAVDISPEKLAFAREMGAVETVNSREEKPSRAIRRITGGGAHVAIDALGIQDTCTNALLSLRKRGRHVQIGLTTYENGGRLELPVNFIVENEIRMCGSFGMPIPEYDALLQMVARGTLKPGRLVTRTISLEQVAQALQDMSTFAGVGVTVVTEF